MNRSILLLTNSTGGYQNDRIEAECRNLGVSFTHYWYSDFTVRFETEGPSIVHKDGVDFHSFSYILPRNAHPSARTKPFLYALSRQSSRVLNGKALLASQGMYDKYIQYMRLAEAHIPIVPTIALFGDTITDADLAFTGLPVVLKHPSGGEGTQVCLCRTKDEINACITEHPQYKLVVQKYMPITYDIRVLVLNHKVLGGMRRTSGSDDFRTNISLGGKAEPYTLSHELVRLALQATDVLDLDYAGVDIVEDSGGAKILEVNLYAQFKGFEHACGVNVARELLTYALNA